MGTEGKDAEMEIKEEVAAPSAPEWPEHFPSECPPIDASKFDGDIYYLVATAPPTPADFRCALELNKFKSHPLCIRASLSCAVTYEEIKGRRANGPLLRNHSIAKATLDESHGVIKQTYSPGHYSMWLTPTTLSTAHEIFEVLT